MPFEKDCTRCHIVKPLTDYSPSKTGRYGRSSRCRACASELMMAKYVPHPRKKPEPIAEKPCRRCATTKPLRGFSPCKAGKAGRNSWCRACLAAYMREKRGALPKRPRRPAMPEEEKRARHKAYRQTKRAKELSRKRLARFYRLRPERVRFFNDRWRASNPSRAAEIHRRRRVRKAGLSEIEFVDIEIVAKRDRYRCHICGKKVARKDRSLDHLHPIVDSVRATHTYRNVALAHRKCNGRRGPGRIPAQLRLH